jgi:lysophospholipase L1-like esterase
MKISIKNQENIACFLIGAVLLLVTFLKTNLFFDSFNWVRFLFPISIIVGFLLVFSFGARLIGIKGAHGIYVLLLIEMLLYANLYISAKNQEKSIIRLPWLNFFYNEIANIMQYDPELSEFDKTLGYRFKSSVSGRFSNLEFDTKITTNSLGLRDDEESLNNPRIIALGDSYTTGWGVENADRFSEILESKTGLCVLNGGVSSFGTVREGLLLDEIDLDSCKMIIIQYCMNDYLENHTWLDRISKGETFKPSFNKAQYLLRVKGNERLSHYTPFRYLHAYLLTIGKRFLSKNFSLPKVATNDMPEHADLFIKGLEIIQKRFKNRILVISLSHSFERLDPAFENVLQEKIISSGLSNIDILRTSHLLKKEDHFFLDNHINIKGHAKVGDALYDYLKDNPLK